jgi:hypothetical protein
MTRESLVTQDWDGLVVRLGGAAALEQNARDTKAFLRARAVASAVDQPRPPDPHHRRGTSCGAFTAPSTFPPSGSAISSSPISMGARHSKSVLSEIGIDMSRYPTGRTGGFAEDIDCEGWERRV